MIKGLYEAHLPVENLQRSIAFYEKLGLRRWFSVDDVAAFWILERVSWLGLWVHEHAQLEYHASTRHVAFQVDYEDLKRAREWLLRRGIEPVADGGFEPIEPYVRPRLGIATLYFEDPDGNKLEFICNVDVPETLRAEKAMYLSEFELLAGSQEPSRPHS
jgi:catechol 2,3-dioxygenase-like lactoylglutathione lyase family enzyme